MGVAVVRETPSLTGKFTGETHRVLELTQNHPPGKQHQKGPICLWAVGEVIESCLRAEQAVLFSLWPSPTGSTTRQPSGLPHPDEYVRIHSLQCNRCAKTKKYGPNVRPDQNSRKTSKWQWDSQPIRCTVQNIGNQDAHRIGWIWLQIRFKKWRLC